MSGDITLPVKASAAKRLAAGHPWVFSNEIDMTPALKALEPGTPVRLEGAGGPLGTAYFNAHTLIAARRLATGEETDPAALIAERIGKALALRERLFDRPFYRLVHAEGDDLPGLVIDRYDDVLVVQANTAGIDRLLPDITACLVALLSPRAIIARNDSPNRALEGLERSVDLLHGGADGAVPVEENGCVYFADVMGGQKTGWFFDHRANRAHVASFAQGARVLDLYAHTGAFGLLCAAQGAQSVALIDRSAPALALAERAIEAAGVGAAVKTHKGDVFAALEHFTRTGETFDVVIADPPAFVKSRKDLKAGIKGYRKVARLCAPLIAPGGVLLAASCSHLVDRDAFWGQTVRGLSDGERRGHAIRFAGAGPDHPVHLHLPETDYLKAMTIILD